MCSALQCASILQLKQLCLSAICRPEEEISSKHTWRRCRVRAASFGLSNLAQIKASGPAQTFCEERHSRNLAVLENKPLRGKRSTWQNMCPLLEERLLWKQAAFGMFASAQGQRMFLLLRHLWPATHWGFLLLKWEILQKQNFFPQPLQMGQLRKNTGCELFSCYTEATEVAEISGLRENQIFTSLN